MTSACEKDDVKKCSETTTMSDKEEVESTSKTTLASVATPEKTAALTMTALTKALPPTTAEATKTTTLETATLGKFKVKEEPDRQSHDVGLVASQEDKVATSSSCERHNGVDAARGSDATKTSTATWMGSSDPPEDKDFKIAVVPKSRKYIRFDERIRTLLQYKEKYGNFDVDTNPDYKTIDPGLARWVRDARKGQYGPHLYKEDKLQIFVEIGFEMTELHNREAVTAGIKSKISASGTATRKLVDSITAKNVKPSPDFKENEIGDATDSKEAKAQEEKNEKVKDYVRDGSSDGGVGFGVSVGEDNNNGKVGKLTKRKKSFQPEVPKSANLAATTQPASKAKRPRKSKEANGATTAAKSQKKKIPEKVRLRNEKKWILSQIPTEVKKEFRQVGFASWRNIVFPVMFVGPFDVPPRSEARNLWMKMFHRINNQKKERKIPIHESMFSRLVYWYGEGSFSLLPKQKTMTYEMGCKHGYNNLPSTIQEKMYATKAGSTNNMASPRTLSATDTQFVKGLKEINEDYKKPVRERQPWLFDFEEESENERNNGEHDDDLPERQPYEVVIEKMKQVMQRAKEKKIPQFNGTSNDWCYLCDDGGQLLVCEFCPNVAHQKCIMSGRKKDHELDYFVCEECIEKWQLNSKQEGKQEKKQGRKEERKEGVQERNGSTNMKSDNSAAMSNNGVSRDKETMPNTCSEATLPDKEVVPLEELIKTVKPMATFISEVEMYIFGREVNKDSGLSERLGKLEITLFGKEYNNEIWSVRSKRLEPYAK